MFIILFSKCFPEGLYGQPNAKKPKIMKQSLDNTFDSITPMSGSIPYPVASQMSNMSNPNKFIKLIGGRDRGRKVKALKVLYVIHCWIAFSQLVHIIAILPVLCFPL